MKKVEVRYKKLDKRVTSPECMSLYSSGSDVRAFLSEDICLKSMSIALIPTGLILQIPQGYEIQVRPRSGLSLKHGITVLNTPGTIDSDYRGEVKIILINLSKEDYTIKNGDRIAQFVLSPVIKAEYKEGEINMTERGDKGFGSSGV